MVTVNNAREGFLEYGDHEILLGCLPQSLKALFVIGFHSGCRLGELIEMRWRDVDWTNRVVRLPDSKNGRKRNLPFLGGIEERLKRQKHIVTNTTPTAGTCSFGWQKMSK